MKKHDVLPTVLTKLILFLFQKFCFKIFHSVLRAIGLTLYNPATFFQNILIRFYNTAADAIAATSNTNNYNLSSNIPLQTRYIEGQILPICIIIKEVSEVKEFVSLF